jgi:hypothetical protein
MKSQMRGEYLEFAGEGRSMRNEYKVNTYCKRGISGTLLSYFIWKERKLF